MSRVTSITLITGPLDEASRELFNQFLRERGLKFTNDVPQFTSLAAAINNLPGSKYYPGSVSAAAWNYGEAYLSDLTSAFAEFSWENPAQVLLIVQPEETAAEVHRLFGY